MNKKTWTFLIGTVAILCLIGLSYAPDVPMSALKDKYTNEASQFTHVQGMNVHYRREGAGPKLVLIHGTAASLHTWDGWVEMLSNDFEVIRLDMPAFGLTGPHPERSYTMNSYVYFLHEFLASQSIDSCYLAGNSLGGAIAWNYSLAYPGEVKKLILLDASGAPKNSPPPAIFKLANTPVISDLLQYVTPRSIIEKNLIEVYFNDEKVTDELIDRYYDLARRPGNRQAFVDRAQLRFSLPTDQLKDIQCPTLIQWGQEDAWIPVDDATFFLDRIPNSRGIIYPKAGHVPMEEIPEQTALDAQSFLME